MSCNRRAVLLSVLMVWVQRCVAVPLVEGSGAFAALKSEKGIITSQTLAYLADQEGSGYSEASEFSSSSGNVPIYAQMSSMEPSVVEGLSSSVYNGPGIDIGTGDSDIVFVDSESDIEESIPEDPTMADSNLYELDRDWNQLGGGGEAEAGSHGEGEAPAGNEVADVTPTEPDPTTSAHEEGGNVIPNNVRHSPPDAGNDLNIVSSERGNEVGGHKGHVDGIGKEATGMEDETGEVSGVPGTGIMAAVMFGGAIAVGALLSFLLVTLTKVGKRVFRKNPDP